MPNRTRATCIACSQRRRTRAERLEKLFVHIQFTLKKRRTLVDAHSLTPSLTHSLTHYASGCTLEIHRRHSPRSGFAPLDEPPAVLLDPDTT
jgi:hypothetical protein